MKSSGNESGKLSLADTLKAKSLKSKDILTKSNNSSETTESAPKAQPVKEFSPEKDVKISNLDKKTFLQDYFKEIEENPSRFSINKSSVYVDDDIHEVFLMIKKNGKVNISKLVSVILEEFILSHKEEIEALMKTKNKFLT